MGTLHNLSPQWLEEQYRLWQRDPQPFDANWRAFFEGFDLGRSDAVPSDPRHALKQSGVQSLIYRYRDLGHLLACTDPLNPCPTSHPLLDLAAFGLDDGDLDTVFHSRRFTPPQATLRDILGVLRATYCRHLGVEFMHIQNPDERQWLIERMEAQRNRPVLTAAEQKEVLDQLLAAARFEAFLHRRFLGQKRFSLEGGEALLPLLEAALQAAAARGVREVVLGMPHRGRLNVLAHTFAKPYRVIFAEFADNLRYQFVGDGDVKYHKGFSSERSLENGETLHLTLAANPSHLEAVDGVVVGKARARQDRHGDGGKGRVLPILLHGDAAFAGQGVVAEILNLSQLAGYGTGGTLHVVINNQIGFTTSGAEGRSTPYATDVAKMLMVPIFHLHGEDPEAAVWAARLALDYRQTFGKDVVIEIVCYRRHGHNEGDEPYFTQPLMYDKIKTRPSVADLYAGELLERGILTRDELAVREAALAATLEEAAGAGPQPDTDSGYGAQWQGLRRDWTAVTTATAVPTEHLLELATRLAAFPDNFQPHPKVAKLLQGRLEAVQSGAEIDWGNAEALAYGSLLATGHSVRLSGQDVRRGTFNHRHAVPVDLASGATFCPLAAVAAAGAVCQIHNSLLAEYAVLAFEYGYSLETPQGLTIWEAQFGDFANGAQVIIDQFISGGSSKWDRASGLVMLLPHGYEGQGAEHSSARIERYLQLCADYNLQVCSPSTPAQFFHLLRRQVLQPFRRPLVVFTPKSLLRHPACRSPLSGLSAGGFHEVIPPDRPAEQVKTVMLCSGKLFFELDERRSKEGRDDVALCRIEQLYPLRIDLLAAALAPYAGAEILWVQEEPMNGGAWHYLLPHLTQLLGRAPRYVGRYAAAAPAVGSHHAHAVEQQNLIDYAFGSILPGAGH